MYFSQKEYQQLLTLIRPQSTEQSKTSHQAANILSTSNPLPSFSGNTICHTTFSSMKIENLTSASSTWIIDTGATDHIIHSINLFSTITKVLNTFVKLPNGENVTVTHLGTVHLSEGLVLKDVLCVPSFAYNLLSITKFTSDQNCCFIFMPEICYIQLPHGR